MCYFRWTVEIANNNRFILLEWKSTSAGWEEFKHTTMEKTSFSCEQKSQEEELSCCPDS